MEERAAVSYQYDFPGAAGVTHSSFGAFHEIRTPLLPQQQQKGLLRVVVGAEIGVQRFRQVLCLKSGTGGGFSCSGKYLICLQRFAK